MTALLPISAPMPIYEAMLALATASERQAILAGGPRELLDNDRMFGREADHDAAMSAFGAMKSILTRITACTDLCVTGIDPRAMPPRREPIDPSVVLYGLLMWEGPGGCMSKLLLAFLHPAVHIGDLRIEPTGQPSPTVQPVMSRSTRLTQGERIDDTSRLALMQGFIIDQADTPNAAARKAAVSEPYRHSTEDSTVKRLVRKFSRLTTR
jgi:hypothetical protein